MSENKPREIQRARAALALTHAFDEDPFFQAIMCDFDHDREERACRMQRYFIFSIEEAFEIGRVSLDGDANGGAAVWLTEQRQGRLAPFRREKEAFVQSLLGPEGWRNYRRLGEFMSGLRPDRQGRDLWYLSLLGISPEARGRGLAAGLLKDGLRAADLAGVPTYLETFNPVAEKIYARLGYRQVSLVAEPVTGRDCRIMYRDPLH